MQLQFKKTLIMKQLLPLLSTKKGCFQIQNSEVNALSLKQLVKQAKQIVRIDKKTTEKSQQFYYDLYAWLQKIIRVFFNKHSQLQQDMVRIFHQSVYMFENQGNILCKIHQHNQQTPRTKVLLYSCLKRQCQLIQHEKQNINKQIDSFNNKVNALRQKFQQRLNIQEINYKNGIERVKRQEREKLELKNKISIANNRPKQTRVQRHSLNPILVGSILNIQKSQSKFKQLSIHNNKSQPKPTQQRLHQVSEQSSSIRSSLETANRQNERHLTNY